MAKIKRPLQALQMSNRDEQWLAILTNQKKIAIRDGYREYIPGSVVIVNAEKGYCLGAEITSVKHYFAKNVPLEDFRADGYNSVNNMIEDLRGYYPDITLESCVTVIRWDNIRGRLLDDFLAKS